MSNMMHMEEEKRFVKLEAGDCVISKAMATHLARPLCASAAPAGAAPWYSSSSAISGSALRLPVPPNASLGPAACHTFESPEGTYSLTVKLAACRGEMMHMPFSCMQEVQECGGRLHQYNGAYRGLPASRPLHAPNAERGVAKREVACRLRRQEANAFCLFWRALIVLQAQQRVLLVRPGWRLDVAVACRVVQDQRESALAVHACLQLHCSRHDAVLICLAHASRWLTSASECLVPLRLRPKCRYAHMRHETRAESTITNDHEGAVESPRN